LPVRILIVKRDKLGDLLLTTPIFAHLATVRPDWKLHLLANDYNAWVARDHPALARTWVYPRVKHRGRVRMGAALAQIPLAWSLRRTRFDAAIAMNGNESARAVRRAMATGAQRVIAYADDPRGYGARLTDPLPVPDAGHEIERMAALLRPLGVEPPAQWTAPVYVLPDAGARFARDWLAQQGLATGGYVVLGLGARREKKQPDVEQLVRWSTRLHASHGLGTVFMWTPGKRDDSSYPGDDDIAQPFLERRLPFVHPYRGPIPEALALIFHARTSVLPDSGLMHFAAASPGGVLGLFANPADSAPASRWSPIGPRARFVEAALAIPELDDATIFAELTPLL
jgi:ADP-heptose:LPS heptosyltransferase